MRSVDDLFELPAFPGDSIGLSVGDEIMTHTPTPWHSEKHEIGDTNNQRIANTWESGRTTDQSIANATFIVKAVNCHERLLNALKKMHDDYMFENDSAHRWKDNYQACQACEAIALAEDKS